MGLRETLAGTDCRAWLLPSEKFFAYEDPSNPGVPVEQSVADLDFSRTAIKGGAKVAKMQHRFM